MHQTFKAARTAGFMSPGPTFGIMIPDALDLMVRARAQRNQISLPCICLHGDLSGSGVGATLSARGGRRALRRVFCGQHRIGARIYESIHESIDESLDAGSDESLDESIDAGSDESPGASSGESLGRSSGESID